MDNEKIINLKKRRIIEGIEDNGSEKHGEIIDFKDLDSIRRGRLKTKSQIEADAQRLSKNFPEQMERRNQIADDMGERSVKVEEMVEVAKDEEKAFNDLVSESIKNCNPKSRLFLWTPDN